MFRSIPGLFLILTLALAGLAPVAAAEKTEEETVTVEVSQDRDERRIESRHLTFDDGTRIHVEVHGDEMRVQLNGEDVPEDRITRERGWLTIHDAEGNVLHRMRMMPNRPPRAGQPPIPPRAPRARGIGGGSAMGMPRGQIGIGLGRIDAALAHHLQLNPDEVIIIAHVREGAPADRAGIKPHDIIIRVEGESPVTPQRLRRLVRERGPGETITLSVLRAGEALDVDIEIEAAQPIGPRAGRPPRAEGIERRMFEFEFDDRAFGDWEWPGADNLRDRLRELLSEEKIEELRGRLLEDFENSLNIEDWDEEAREKAKELAERAAARARQFIERLGNDEVQERLQRRLDIDLESIPGIEFLRENGRVRGLIVSPSRPPRPEARHAPDRAVERLERRLERLEQQLERVEQMLARLAEGKTDMQ